MGRLWQRMKDRIGVSYGQKVSLLASLPLLLAALAIAILVAAQYRQTAQQEIKVLQDKLITAKRAELKNYLSLARTAFINIYGRALPDDEDAKLLATQTLSAMLYGQDGYFFVYDYDGTNLVSPRRTELIGKNWQGVAGLDGQMVVDQMISIARQGGGYMTYDWPKPSTGETERMVSYVVGLQDWRWVVGTGVFIDDVLATIAAEQAEVETRVQRTFLYIGVITLGALLLVFLSGMFLNLRERRLADTKLKGLTQRILDTQEEERGRVARELHDSISQILVGVRYTFELARKRVQSGDKRVDESLDKGITSLNSAIQEVRRISHDLRPGVLDDLGLGPALQALTQEFSQRTGIKTELETVVFRNRLDPESKIALFRIAQEALTNIERHAGATHVSIKLFGHKKGATLRISDNGRGINIDTPAPLLGGLGLRNMQERVEQLDGTLRMSSTRNGTVIEAKVPLTHLLPPEENTRKNP
jgi:two-component system NarL family sensor kinase